MTADPEVLQKFTLRTRCFMCKHRFDKPLLLPVEQPAAGQLQPNVNSQFLFHVNETHGIPANTVEDWIIGAVYGLELTEFGYRR